MMRIFKLLTLSLIWLVAWFAIFGFVTYFLGDSLGWYSQLKNTFYECLVANLIKALLFFIFVYFQLSIVRNALKPNVSLFLPLNIVDSCRNEIKISNQPQRFKINLLLAVNICWVAYYSIVSLLLLMSTERFMGDCDVSDIVCTCDNSIYMYLTILIMFITSVVYINLFCVVNVVKK